MGTATCHTDDCVPLLLLRSSVLLFAIYIFFFLNYNYCLVHSDCLVFYFFIFYFPVFLGLLFSLELNRPAGAATCADCRWFILFLLQV